MKRLGYVIKAVAVLMLGLLPACHVDPSGLGSPQPTIYVPYIESIEVDDNLQVGQEAVIRLTLSTEMDPGLLDGSTCYWYTTRYSQTYNEGVKNGTYQQGEFIGLYLIKGNEIAPGPSERIASQVIERRYTPSSSGTKYLYFMSAASREYGGTTSKETMTPYFDFDFSGRTDVALREVVVEVPE